MENLKELSFEEMVEVDGGGWIEDLKNLAIELDENWDKIKSRLKEGWDSYSPSCSC